MKKFFRYFLFLVAIVAIGITGYVVIKTSYKGNSQIVFLNSGKSYTSFQEIIQRPEFKNKVVYVDIWGTSCPPCFDELKNYTPKLTERYKDNKDIAFLYICLDQHPLPEVRWKDKVQKFQPLGYHVLVEAEEQVVLAQEIVGKANEGKYFPYIPFYFIVNKQGKIVGKPNAKPEEGELQPSDSVLLYDKLDSLLQM